MTLTADELSGMRAAQLETMSESCTVSRRTLTSDNAGGFSESFSTAATTVCRLGGLRNLPEESALAGKASGRMVQDIYLPALSDVRTDDRIVTGGRTFEVLGVEKHTYETARQCVCVERT